MGVVARAGAYIKKAGAYLGLCRPDRFRVLTASDLWGKGRTIGTRPIALERRMLGATEFLGTAGPYAFYREMPPPDPDKVSQLKKFKMVLQLIRGHMNVGLTHLPIARELGWDEMVLPRITMERVLNFIVSRIEGRTFEFEGGLKIRGRNSSVAIEELFCGLVNINQLFFGPLDFYSVTVELDSHRKRDEWRDIPVVELVRSDAQEFEEFFETRIRALTAAPEPVRSKGTIIPQSGGAVILPLRRQKEISQPPAVQPPSYPFVGRQFSGVVVVGRDIGATTTQANSFGLLVRERAPVSRIVVEVSVPDEGKVRVEIPNFSRLAETRSRAIIEIVAVENGKFIGKFIRWEEGRGRTAPEPLRTPRDAELVGALSGLAKSRFAASLRPVWMFDTAVEQLLCRADIESATRGFVGRSGASREFLQERILTVVNHILRMVRDKRNAEKFARALAYWLNSHENRGAIIRILNEPEPPKTPVLARRTDDQRRR